MNDYHLFEQLCVLENITNRYQYAKECQITIRELEDFIKSRTYRVAVIGEFKRGKSSLINALIGAGILPTDILPMTAAITHIRYGEEKRITICYHDGAREHKSIDELIDFATKYDKEKERVSARIKEIQVSYPSVLCKNNVEIFDTPGMNDDENMSKITLDILGDIDAAVMVISACSPLSMTEQELILRIIREKGIRHIIFVVTYIDAVSDDVEEQDQILAYIKRRLGADLLKKAERQFETDDALAEKARRILSDATVYGVSSTLAMEGFTADSKQKLRLSRIPTLKQELLDYLTAAQSIDEKERFIEVFREIRDHLSAWYETERDEAAAEKRRLQQEKTAVEAYYSNAPQQVAHMLAAFEQELRSIGMLEAYDRYSQTLYQTIRRFLIQALFTIRENTYTEENLQRTLAKAYDQADELIGDVNALVHETVTEALQRIIIGIDRLYPRFEDQPEDRLLSELQAACAERMQRLTCPALCLDRAALTVKPLRGVNLIEIAEASLNESLARFSGAFEAFFRSWKAFLLQQQRKLIQHDNRSKSLSDRIEALELKLRMMAYHRQQDMELLKKIASTSEENTSEENITEESTTEAVNENVLY
ncbi:dynamin family protein [Ruminococcus sp.]|uniref:dynamin family protein n=1 Tax=Ruminococcus sp. TaxID=41978 RepID=UPI00388F2569